MAVHVAGRVGLVVAMVAALTLPATAGTDDAFLVGYVTAVVEREMDLRGAVVRVRAGVVQVTVADLSITRIERLRLVLSAIEGVREVVIGPPAAAGGVVNSPPKDGPVNAPIDAPAGVAQVNVAQPSDGELSTTAVSGRAPAVSGWFPPGRLFDPLLADPRWPHFAAAYHQYQDRRIEHVATVSMGETITFYRTPAPKFMGGDLEVVLQPGVFAFFDLDSESADLQNADYLIGGGVAWRRGGLSVLARVFHQSSHLGDEFILSNGTVSGDPGAFDLDAYLDDKSLALSQRINLSYEALHLLASWDHEGWLRLYGGGGVLFDVDPVDLPVGIAQYGLELLSPWRFFDDRIRPVAAVDVKHWQYTRWHADLSVRAGVEFMPSQRSDGRLLLLAEHYDGHSPNGQFFSHTIRYLGVGLHYFY